MQVPAACFGKPLAILALPGLPHAHKPEGSGSVIRYDDLRLEESQAEELRAERLANENEYFIKSGKYENNQV